MGKIGNVVISLDCQDASFSKGLKKAETDVKSFRDKSKGFIKDLAADFGKKSLLGQSLKLMAGGGAIGALSMATGEFANVTAKILEMKKAFQDGQVSGVEMFQKIAEQIPVLGGIFKAGANIREMFTGEQGQIDSINRQAKAIDMGTEAIRKVIQLKQEWASFQKTFIKDMNSDLQTPLGKMLEQSMGRYGTVGTEGKKKNDEIEALRHKTLELNKQETEARSKSSYEGNWLQKSGQWLGDTFGSGKGMAEYSNEADTARSQAAMIRSQIKKLQADRDRQEKEMNWEATKRNTRELGVYALDGIKSNGTLKMFEGMYSGILSYPKHLQEIQDKAVKGMLPEAQSMKEMLKSPMEKLAGKFQEIDYMKRHGLLEDVNVGDLKRKVAEGYDTTSPAHVADVTTGARQFSFSASDMGFVNETKVMSQNIAKLVAKAEEINKTSKEKPKLFEIK